MNLLKNYTSRDDKELIRLLAEKYSMDTADYILSRDDHGRILVKIITDKEVLPAIDLRVTANGMRAYLDIFPGINTDKVLTVDDVMAEMQAEKVTVNVNREDITSAVAMAKDGAISEKLLVAEGVEAISGKNALIVLNFEPVRNRPQILKNGRVDYRNLDNIRVVREGDLLMTKKPATAGVRGLTVRNEEISSEPGQDTEIYAGEGVRSEKDGMEFYAKTDGCVNFTRNTLEVSPVFSVRGNVDYSTGNIVFNGNVYVKEDVLSNFSIKAEKDIFIDGVCQDADLEAGGNIVIKLGVKGEGRGVIRAKGDVLVGYAENAVIEAKGNIEITKYAYNSKLRAGGSLNATKEPGIVAGGEATAFSEITVQQAGTVGNSKFAMSVGTKFYFEEEMNSLNETKNKFLANKAKIDEFLGSVNLKKKEVLDNPKVRQLIGFRKQLNEKIAVTDAQMEKLIKEAHHPRPKLKVLNELYGGIEIQVYRDKMQIKENQRKMIFFYDDKYQQIQALSLEDQDWHDE